MLAIIKRDLRSALRSGGAWLHSLLFFVIFITLCAVALGGDKSVLRPLAPALVWLSAILAMLLSFERVFQTDAEDGTLEQYALSGLPTIKIAGAKIAAHFMLTALPLIAIAPAAGSALGLNSEDSLRLTASLILGAPALVIYGGFAGACLMRYRQAGLLIILITVPLLLPLLIFGIDMVDASDEGVMFGPQAQALTGISLLAIGLGLPAITGAINAQME